MGQLSGALSCCAEPGEILVLPREGGHGDLMERAIPGLGGDLVSSFEALVRRAELGHGPADRHSVRSASPFVIRVPEAEVEHRLRDLEHHPSIAAATRNWRVSLENAGFGVDSVRDFVSQHGPRMPLAAPYPSRPAHVAIIDSGVHPDAACCPGQLPAQLDVTATTGSIRTAPHDPVGHGTVVAAIVHSIDPHAVITSIRCFDNNRSTLSDIVSGLLLGLLLPQPVDVFNLSLKVDVSVETCPSCGYETFGPSAEASMRRLLDHVRFTAAAEPLFIAAAGNDAPRVAVPAALDGVVAVGSTGASPMADPLPDPRYRAVPGLFLLAPGGSDDDPVGSTGAPLPTRWRGTSFATAVVSGAAANLVSGGWDVRAEPPGLKGASLLSRLDPFLWRSFPGYDGAVHGAGVLR